MIEVGCTVQLIRDIRYHRNHRVIRAGRIGTVTRLRNRGFMADVDFDGTDVVLYTSEIERICEGCEQVFTGPGCLCSDCLALYGPDSDEVRYATRA